MKHWVQVAGVVAIAGCAARGPQIQPQMDPAPLPVVTDPVLPPTVSDAAVEDRRERVLPPAEAFARGLMPLHSTGVPEFATAHPNADGRGVLIAILDSGIDPSVSGLQTTSQHLPKVLDIRDFSGEGRIALSPIARRGDTVLVAGIGVLGASRLAGLAVDATWWGGVLDELPLGTAPAADFDGNGTVGDKLPVVVVRGAGGWVLFADTQGNGTFADDRPIRDYATAREYFGWSRSVRAPSVQMAVNLTDSAGTPRLDLVFDNSSHGTHVAGIAAGHTLYGVQGFDGVAPGARILALKISNNAQGGITVTGSMTRALDHAIRFAEARQLPLVVNISFGIGNEREGAARIDAVIDSILVAHPKVIVTVAAGNDGPGLSTLGFPGSANRVVSVGATQPVVFNGLPPDDPTPDPMAPFSSRGGEARGPDIAVPGTAYSTIPDFAIGDEIASGTSMASPHAAGLFARLLSALVPAARPAALTMREAIRSSGAGSREIEPGVWVPSLSGALRSLTTLAAGAVPTASRIATGATPAATHSVLPGESLNASEVVKVPAGGTAHLFIPIQAGRAFQVEVATGAAEERVTASLHEPGGMPFRDGASIPAGFSDGAALFEVGGQDAVDGMYEVAIVAGPLAGGSARVTVRRAPLRLAATQVPDSLQLVTSSLIDGALSVRLRAGMVGAELRRSIAASDDRHVRVAVPVPSWAAHTVIDTRMPPEAWPEFTDFGVTLQDRYGRQIDAQPMNYAFGRATSGLPDHVVGDSLIVLLAPAFAERSASWTVEMAIRFYARDVTEMDGGGTPFEPLPARGTLARRFMLGPFPLALPVGFRPLMIVVVLEGDDHTWMQEFSLDPVGGSPDE